MEKYLLDHLSRESEEEMMAAVDAAAPELPENAPRYLMGVGTPVNILEGIERGYPFFQEYHLPLSIMD